MDVATSRAASSGDPGLILPILRPRPMPTRTSVSHLRVGAEVVTSIYREWPAGAAGPHGTCRRCPSCSASGDRCHLQVRAYVERDRAASFALADLPAGVVRQDL